LKPFIDEISRLLSYNHPELIEKDILLHNILLALSKQKDFRDSYIFKGGTCLIKAYLGYFRFSEDLDFTWADQSEFEKLTGMM